MNSIATHKCVTSRSGQRDIEQNNDTVHVAAMRSEPTSSFATVITHNTISVSHELHDLPAGHECRLD